MQKKLIALAIAGLAAAPAFAQSNVTVYGYMDMAMVNRSGNDGGVQGVKSTTALNSGVSAGNRIGFKGTEALGNGTSALFQHELQIFSDVGNLSGGNNGVSATGAGNNGQVGVRNSYVGLTGNWGTAVAGHLDGARYGVALKYDAFSGGTVAQGVSIQTHASRADNAIAYISPTWSGFSFIAAYTTNLVGQEGAGNVGDARLWAIQPNYTNGPLALTFNYESLKVKEAAFGNKADVEIVAMGGSYDFNIVKIMGYYENVKRDDPAWALANSVSLADQRAYTLGATIPVGANGLVRMNYSKLDDKTTRNGDCNKFGIGYKHSLSKRTFVYTDYARINNDNVNSKCTIATSASTNSVDNYGNATPGAGGLGVNGFDIGLAHSF